MESEKVCRKIGDAGGKIRVKAGNDTEYNTWESTENMRVSQCPLGKAI